MVRLPERRKPIRLTLFLSDPRTLEAHRKSLDNAKGTLAKNLERGRDILRDYKRPLSASIDARRQQLETSLRSRNERKKDLEDLKAQKPLQDAKKLVRDSLPCKTRGPPRSL